MRFKIEIALAALNWKWNEQLDHLVDGASPAGRCEAERELV